MKQLMEVNPMRLLVGACSLGLILSLSQVGVAQQTAKTLAIPPQPVAAASLLNAFEPTSFSALMPGTATAHAASSPVVDEEEESPKPNSAGHQGVKVHGHWVLQVKNADGSLGERREFENSLVTTSNSNHDNSGSQLVVALLSGNAAAGDPGIAFIQGSLTGDPSGLCFQAGPTPAATCYVFTSSNSLLSSNNLDEDHLTQFFAATSLGLTYQAVFRPTPAIVLSGNYTVPTGLTSISAVQSLYGVCAPISAVESGTSAYLDTSGNFTSSASFRNADFSSQQCSSAATGLLYPNVETEVAIAGALTSTAVTSNASGTPVATPMAVTPGQIIQVTVTLSFS